MKLVTFFAVFALGMLGTPLALEAQQARVYRVGVIHHGGPYNETIQGLRDGLRQLGLEEPKDLVLDIRDTKGDLKAVQEAARNLVREKVKLIYAVTTNVTTVVRQVTTGITIVFAVGADPVAEGLVDSFAKPGGRLTGIHYLTSDLTAKRLEVLKEILPKARRVVTFYNPNQRVAREGARLGREAGRHLRIEFVERHAASVEELRAALQALKAGEADAFFLVPDALVISQAQLIIDTARAKRLPTMFHERSIVAMGALASYGVNNREIGRLSAKYVHRILAGANPNDLPVENVDRLELVLNLRAARELGLTIPQSLVLRADHVIK